MVPMPLANLGPRCVNLKGLDAYPAAYLGLAVNELRAHCVAVRQEVAGNPDSWPDRVAALPLPINMDRLRGDEVELEG